MAQTAAEALPERVRWVMGTYLRIVVVDPALTVDEAEAAMELAFAAVEQWNGWLSPWVPGSEQNRVQESAPAWVEVPAPVFSYFSRSRRDASRTNGIFDLTVGGLWLSPPGRVDWRRLELDPDGSRVRLAEAGMALDPGGNGKGVAVDAAVVCLRSGGVRRALVDFGGSSWYALGLSPSGAPWRVGLSDPEGTVIATASLVDQALSTSSSLRVDEGDTTGVAVPHIVDPRSGHLVREARSVAVVSPSATDAEVLSTALVVTGAAGWDMLEHFDGASACLLDAGGLTPSGDALPWLSPRSSRE